MADNFLQFMSGLGSTPPKVYGTSAEDVALRQQMSGGANYWNNTTPAQTGYMPAADGPSYQNAGQMYAPTYGGNGATTPVRTTAVGPIDRATAANNHLGQAMSWTPSSGQRSIADLLAGIGSYGGPASLSQPSTAAGAAAKLAQGGAPKQGYAPWGTYSRSLAYNNLNPDPAPPAAPQGEPWGVHSRGLAFHNFINPPAAPQGANPGLGGAMIGNGQMNPGIPPQLPPADGSSPLPVWAGDNPQQAGGQSLGINVRGGQQPNVSPSERYSLANMLGQINAQKAQSNATGQAGGYQYQNGQRVGYAPQTIGGNTYTPNNPAAAYGLANAAGQIAALIEARKQATAAAHSVTLVTPTTGTVNGGSDASAYEAAAARSRDRGTSGEGGNPSWW